MKRMINQISCMLMTMLITTVGMAQNNAIFKGGTADGWSTRNYSQSSGNIFKGGVADGYASSNFQQSSLSIFKGGAGDGWDSKNFNQSNLSIYKGGNGDGWDSKNRVQASTVIHKGGAGDGWASSYLPQQALPVVFLSFTAQKQGNSAALVQWKTASEINAGYFDVERSSDAVAFENIGKVFAAGSSSGGFSYSFTDNHPAKGINYYRLKQMDKDGHFTYTPSRMLRFDDEGAGIVKYYPNPTNGILNIEISSQMQSEAIVVNISNTNGVVLNQMKIGAASSSVITVSMSRYPKGVYFVQVKTGSTNSVQRIVLE